MCVCACVCVCVCVSVCERLNMNAGNLFRQLDMLIGLTHSTLSAKQVFSIFKNGKKLIVKNFWLI